MKHTGTQVSPESETVDMVTPVVTHQKASLGVPNSCGVNARSGSPHVTAPLDIHNSKYALLDLDLEPLLPAVL